MVFDATFNNISVMHIVENSQVVTTLKFCTYYVKNKCLVIKLDASRPVIACLCIVLYFCMYTVQFENL
jgi:hypothetical protein